MAVDAATTDARVGFRKFVPDEDYKRFDKKFLARASTYEWLEYRYASDPFVHNWSRQWKEKLEQPYKGITTDGAVRQGLFNLDDGQPVPSQTTRKMKAAADSLIEKLTSEQLQTLTHDVDAKEWRAWSNPELYIFRHGLRLEEMSDQFVDAVHRVFEASLSPSGYVKVRDCMRVNHFLGEVVNGPGVLNSRSYNFSLFGQPSFTKPWGWQLTGHHLCMNCFILGSQQVVTPVFMGAEPNYIDAGKWQNMSLFDNQELAGLEIMKVLPPTLIDEVRIYKTVNDPNIPEWRIHRADQRHLGGAFQDNRVIPYEGCLVCKFPIDQQDMIRNITRLSLGYLPQDTLDRKMAEMERHWDETYFCWIGGWGLEDAFYYKIHSPVVMLEFDHHTGVFLSNQEPKPFHIHTTVRTPNGNDYGKEFLRQYQDRKAQDKGS